MKYFYIIQILIFIFITKGLAGASTNSEDWINVKTDCGAIGDSLVDDTEAIQNALDTATNGQTVYFPPDTYHVSNLIIPDKELRLLGYGAILKKIPNEGNSLYLIASNNWVNSSWEAQKHVVVEGIAFDGDGNADRAVFIHQGTQSIFRYCMFQNGSGSGLLITSETKNGNSIVGDRGVMIGNRIINCTFENNGENGLHLNETEPQLPKVSQTHIIGGEFYNNLKWGLWLDAAEGTWITNIHLSGNALGGMYIAEMGKGTIIDAVYITDVPSIIIVGGSLNAVAMVSNSVLGGECQCKKVNFLEYCISAGNRYLESDGSVYKMDSNWLSLNGF